MRRLFVYSGKLGQMRSTEQGSAGICETKLMIIINTNNDPTNTMTLRVCTYNQTLRNSYNLLKRGTTSSTLGRASGFTLQVSFMRFQKHTSAGESNFFGIFAGGKRFRIACKGRWVSSQSLKGCLDRINYNTRSLPTHKVVRSRTSYITQPSAKTSLASVGLGCRLSVDGCNS